ncbi:hypothetical protein PVL29_005589 [Vitis rotundifolia]|uniref:N-acetyltransferase domain-containing protein n=1 Tax=Vitis rotundifolia TaxID=103349 RepID=A0AA39DY67_VITRO|nr:hypothetical protein PVL29_005589 [Vitis rotundifolia]
MVDNIHENKVLIREFNEETDIEAVEKLEKNCEIGYKKGISIFTSMMGDPLCRIRLYPVHVMLVAQLLENGELVGAVRGCIKRVGTGFGGTDVTMGCILGLRVSPRHRRMGIGLGLVKSAEEWIERNGAQYAFLATEENNVASTNLFTLKCNYVKFSSLVIYVQPVNDHLAEEVDVPRDIKIEKLHIEQAISLYKSCLKQREIYPTDIEAILKEKLSMGTWVCFFSEEGWVGLQKKEEKEGEIMGTAPSSWAIFSIWNTSEAYKLQIRRSNLLKICHASVSHAMERILPCLKLPFMSMSTESHKKPFGFLFLYGIHGEGERIGELMKAVWRFASRMAENVKDCSVMMTELGGSDPLRAHVPQGSSMSCINDLWYLKRLNAPVSDEDELTAMRPVGNVFVDPRDF